MMIISNSKKLFASLTLLLSSIVLFGSNVDALVSQKLSSNDDTISFSIGLEKNETFGSVLSDIPKIMKDGGLFPVSDKTVQNIEIHFNRVPKGYLNENHEDGAICVSKEKKKRIITIDAEKLVSPFLSLKDAKEVKKETKAVKPKATKAKTKESETNEAKELKMPFNIRIVWDNVSPSLFTREFNVAEKEISKNKKVAFHSAGKVITVNCPEEEQKTTSKKTEKVRKIEGLIVFEDIVDENEFTATEGVEVWGPDSSKN
ncbi:hypothetical protein FACS189481_5120 [Clostridia bacterium]|nr:hypothetical protein FACS189481_5120 [Clostridia bacterium]